MKMANTLNPFDPGHLSKESIMAIETEASIDSLNKKKNYRKGVKDTLLVIGIIAGIGIGGILGYKAINNHIKAKKIEEQTKQAQIANQELIREQLDVLIKNNANQDAKIDELESIVARNSQLISDNSNNISSNLSNNYAINLKLTQIQETLNSYQGILSEESITKLYDFMDKTEELYGDNIIFKQFKESTEKILADHESRISDLESNVSSNSEKHNVNIIYGNNKLKDNFSLSKYENGLTVDELLHEIDVLEGYNVQAVYAELPDGQMIINFGHNDMENNSLNLYLSKIDEDNETQETYQKVIVDNWKNSVPVGNFKTLSRRELKELLEDKMSQYNTNLVLVKDNLFNSDDIDTYVTFGATPEISRNGKYLHLNN